MDFITRKLAAFLDTFKAKNPTLWAIIVLVLLAIQYILTKGVDLGVFEVSPIVQEWQGWVNTILLVIGSTIGSHTNRYLNKNPDGDKEAHPSF